MKLPNKALSTVFATVFTVLTPAHAFAENNTLPEKPTLEEFLSQDILSVKPKQGATTAGAKQQKVQPGSLESFLQEGFSKNTNPPNPDNPSGTKQENRLKTTLAPKPNTNQTPENVTLPALAPRTPLPIATSDKASTEKHDISPWLIGGGAVAGIVVIAFLIGASSRSDSRERNESRGELIGATLEFLAALLELFGNSSRHPNIPGQPRLSRNTSGSILPNIRLL